MKYLSVLILTFALIGPVWAGSFTVTSTAEQDTVLAQMLVDLNVRRAAQTPPKTAIASVDLMVQGIMNRAFKSYVRSARVKSHETTREAWRNATQAERDQIRTILGMP